MTAWAEAVGATYTVPMISSVKMQWIVQTLSTSVGPSCGSASNLVIPQSANNDGRGLPVPMGSSTPPSATSLVVDDDGVRHGDESFGGSGSYVNTDAILKLIDFPTLQPGPNISFPLYPCVKVPYKNDAGLL